MRDTDIQWCDSTINIQMGCEGCELVKGQKKPRCYAKVMTDRYAGQNGWPDSFEQPKIFPHRLQSALDWPDLTGQQRANKPWLNGMPRIIFLNDMGDTFSRGMPEDWLAPFLPAIAASPHIWMLLTKWPRRMIKFASKHPLPANVWPGTSITSNKTAFRSKELNEAKIGGGIKWLSVEPMWEHIHWPQKDGSLKSIKLMIYGGESGRTAKPLNMEWIWQQIHYCKVFKKACFVKQLGSNPFRSMDKDFNVRFKVNDFHGGDWNEWPEAFRVREFPKLKKELPEVPFYNLPK